MTADAAYESVIVSIKGPLKRLTLVIDNST